MFNDWECGEVSVRRRGFHDVPSVRTLEHSRTITHGTRYGDIPSLSRLGRFPTCGIRVLPNNFTLLPSRCGRICALFAGYRGASLYVLLCGVVAPVVARCGALSDRGGFP